MEDIDDTPHMDENDPFNLFPGIPTKPVGAFDVPVPVPLSPPGQSPTTTDDQVDTTDNQSQPGEAGMSEIERAVEAGENYIDRVEAAMDEETCDLCKQILDNLRARPLEEQVQGVKELAELKQAANRGADATELAEVMEDFEVVDDPSAMM